MLTFMNSKLPDDWQISDKQYHIFQKSKSYEISNTDIYVGEYLELLFMYIQLFKLYLVIKSALALKVNTQKTFDFFQNSSVPFHQIVFDHSVLCLLLIGKPNESCQNSKTFERNTLSTKKAFKKKRKVKITPAKANDPISQTSSEYLKLTIQIYRMRNKKNLK